MNLRKQTLLAFEHFGLHVSAVAYAGLLDCTQECSMSKFLDLAKDVELVQHDTPKAHPELCIIFEDGTMLIREYDDHLEWWRRIIPPKQEHGKLLTTLKAPST